MHFAPDAIRWLGIWLDSALTLQENRQRRIGKTRQAEATIRQIVNQYGVPPASARNLQMALVQGTMLYAAELTWSGRSGAEGEYQRAINRRARSTLGALRSTPQGILAAESGLTLARALLDHRQARFAHRLLAQPRDGGGAEETLTREGAAITTRVKTAGGTRRGETVEPQVLSEGKTFLGRVVIQEREQHWLWLGAGIPTAPTPFGQMDRGLIAATWEQHVHRAVPVSGWDRVST